MDESSIKDLIKQIKQGRVSEDEALLVLKNLPFQDIGHTKIDLHRALRQGMAEVIFAEGKTEKQITSIIKEMIKSPGEVLITRIDHKKARAVKKEFPKAVHNSEASTIRIKAKPAKKKAGPLKKDLVAVVSAGTADSPVVEETRETLLWLGINPQVITDVGVSGVHRLLAHREKISTARVIIVVAGMEGALTSVVGGIVDKPVIGVPTSIGYGAGAGGIAALLGMLNSCAAGVVVTNIDNGFGAACAAARILRSAEAPE